MTAITALATLQRFVYSRADLKACLNMIHPHIAESYQECYVFAFDQEKPYDDTYRLKIDYILNYLHEFISTGNFMKVSYSKRVAFTGVSYVKSLIILKRWCNETIQEALKCLDNGFLLGLPFEHNRELLSRCASFLTGHLEITSDERLVENSFPNKRIKVNSQFEEMNAIPVDIVKVPTLEEFYKSYFLPEKPVIVQDCMSYWPACTKWLDIKYLLKTAGERTVPIELGSSYSDENFSQKLMTLREFIEKYYLENANDLGYLAQHDLLNQVPELKDDIRIPEYCCTSRNFDDDNLFEPEINAWFGPKGTVSSLHHDPKDNLLCQVFGAKEVILFAPSDSEYLYAHEEMLLSNTAQVDPIKPDLMLYPNYAKATMYKCLLSPTEMLYIPPKWWHHITALDRSFSVNFWWQ